jgi:hypothetical protein
MCFGGGSSAPASTAAATQQAVQSQADQTQANIATGNSDIDSAFSQFDPAYYQGYQNAYTNYYDPQVDTQYNDAEGTLESGLARNGLDRSSVAASQIGTLFQDYGTQKAAIANQAVDASNTLEGQVASAKSNLYALNAAAADPATANTQALAASTALVAPSTFSPLGSVFANAIAPYTAYANAANNSAGSTSYAGSNTGAGVN